MKRMVNDLGINKIPIEAMEMELERLVGIRDRASGIYRKRISHKISELGIRIDYARRNIIGYLY